MLIQSGAEDSDFTDEEPREETSPEESSKRVVQEPWVLCSVDIIWLTQAQFMSTLQIIVLIIDNFLRVCMKTMYINCCERNSIHVELA